MAEIVNLRTARKRAARRQAEQTAEANRLAHGISKDERSVTEARQDKAARDLEGHRRDDSEQ